jgi:phage FluMu gp28-like protein
MGRAKVNLAKNTLLLPYQERWVKDRARLKIAEKSRQIGWTWATAYRLVREKSLKTARLDAWISSRDDIQARLFLEDCKGFANVLQLAAQDLGESVIDERGHSAHVLKMATGLRINSMSSNPDAQAGKRGDRVLDEFALHPDPRKLYAIAYPGITWGGSLEVFSTHRGSGNYFNKLIREIREKNNPMGWSLHRVTLEDALADGFLVKLQSKLPDGDERQEMDEAEYFDFIRKGCVDNESFLQEFMCVAADDASAFLPFDLIDACCYKEGEQWEYTIEQAAKCGNPLFAGVDIGRKHDLTSLIVIERVAGMNFIRKRIDLQKMQFSTQESVLYPWFEICRRVCIDKTGLGMQFAERAAQRFGTYRVEGVNFSGPVKEDLAFPVRSAFEDRAIRIPFGDDSLVADLRKIRKETTASGNIRFVADSDADGHADRFWSLALALHAGKSNAAPVAFETMSSNGLSKSGRGRKCAL